MDQKLTVYLETPIPSFLNSFAVYESGAAPIAIAEIMDKITAIPNSPGIPHR